MNKLLKICKKFFAMFSSRQWTIIGILLLANLVNTITFNCMDAFYPKEAHRRHISTSKISIIMGMYQLARFLMAPLAGKYIIQIGPKLAYFAGLFLTAATAIGFGLLTLLPDLEDDEPFFWASLGIRIFQALARSCFVVSSLTITAQLFPDHISFLGGLSETFAGIGYISGPMIGSFLFELGGFILPNMTMGTLMAITGVVFVCFTSLLLTPNSSEANSVENNVESNNEASRRVERPPTVPPTPISPIPVPPTPTSKTVLSRKGSSISTLRVNMCDGDLERATINDPRTPTMATALNAYQFPPITQEEEEESREFGYFSLLQHGKTWLLIFVIVLRGISMSFFQAPLPEHLNSLSPSAMLVGSMYTVMSISYMASSPVWGLLVAKIKGSRPTTLITLAGSAFAAGGCLLLGPFPLFPFEKSIPLIVVSFALLGFSSSALYIPSFGQCSEISKELSSEEDEASNTEIYAYLFGLVQAASTLGSFIGSLLGGFGAEHIGFAWTSSAISLAHLIFATLFSAYSLLL